MGYGVGSNSSFDPQKHLEDLVAKQLISCGGAGRFIIADIETTRHEIPEVPRMELLGTADEAITRCVREGVWSFALPTAFSAERASWTVRG